LGISQLKKLDEFIRRRAEIVKLYNEAFEAVPEIETPIAIPYVKPAWHIYTILLNGIDRERPLYPNLSLFILPRTFL
jgi:dTDP-4-amino-4,6-dideoxygalactose transaminase